MHSWLVKKKRDQEALMVLSKINHHRKGETFVDTYFQLESLRESVETTLKKKSFLVTIRELCQAKYLYR